MQQPEASPEAMIASFRADVERRLEEGLQAIQQSAIALMREIASEVWRTAGGDKDDIRETILEELSRDQAIRALVTHTDERFQALAVRAARLEESIGTVAESVRTVSEQLADGVALLAKMGSTDGRISDDASALRAQLAEVTEQVAAALGQLADRDQAIVDAVRTRIREHGELITQETARISGAMEGYVQHGVQAIGQLAGSMQGQVDVIADRDRELEERVTKLFSEQMRLLAEQLQLMYERMAIDTTSLGEQITHMGERTEERTRSIGEYLHLLNDRIGVASRESAGEVSRVVDARVMGLARMVRSDAEALRAELARVAAEQEATIAGTLEERETAVARMLDDRFAYVSDTVAEAVAARSEETGARLEARWDEQARLVEARMSESSTELRDQLSSMTDALDGKITGLARLIRSDNETLAQQLVADQEASKQALRATKELQAALPNEVIEMVEQRFASLAESIERSNEMLAKRIDRMAETIGARHETDIQVVVDRMGDAMHALASLGRPPGGVETSDPRIELD